MYFFKKSRKIKVCFFLMYHSVFSAKNIYYNMLRDNKFDPFIVIIPDIMRSNGQELALMKQEYNAAYQKYEKVYSSYDFLNNRYTDFSKNCDIAFVSTLYKNHTHKFYTPEYFKEKGVRTCFVNYGYSVSKYGNNILNGCNVDKVFIESEIIKNELKLPNNRICCLGNPKMDNFVLAYKKMKKRLRKRILISPHHTIINWENGLNLSNFIKYSDFFLQLPKFYPQIDFVYRPHQLLSYNLKHFNIWDDEKISNYINTMRSYSNVYVSHTSEDYFDIFVNSDGIIHDCGSFMAEYLFSGNPACYMINEHTRQDLNDFGNKCVDMHYQAFNEQDIVNFIDNVILNGEDPMKEKRRAFVYDELKINYPNSAKAICKYIKKELI